MPLHRRRSSVNAVIQISAPFPLRGEAFRRPRVERRRQNSRNLVRKLRSELFLRCFRNKVYRPLERTTNEGCLSPRFALPQWKKGTPFPRCLLIQISASKFPRQCVPSRLYGPLYSRKWHFECQNFVSDCAWQVILPCKLIKHRETQQFVANFNHRKVAKWKAVVRFHIY